MTAKQDEQDRKDDAAERAAERAADRTAAAKGDGKKKPHGTVAEREKKIAELQAEILELQQPDPVPYPKAMYHPDAPSVTVNSKAEEEKLGAGWVDTPEDFPHVKKDSKEAAALAGSAKVVHDRTAAERK